MRSLLKASHWSESRFESSVITLDAVGVLVGVVERVRDQFFDHGLECLSEIGDDLVWFAVCGQCCGEKRSGGGDVAAW